MKTILTISGLTKSFGKRPVLRGVDLTLRAGETVCLLGTNGAGKSTLLRCLLGLERLDTGKVRCLDDTPRMERIGYVPDHSDVFGWMTTTEFLRFLAPAYPTWSTERARAYTEALHVPMDTPFNALSRGEAQKALIAAALVPAPKLVVLDEAFARLAPPVRDEVLEFFVREAPIDGGAALFATHDLDVAARLADRVLLLDEGVTRELPACPEGTAQTAHLRSHYSASPAAA